MKNSLVILAVALLSCAAIAMGTAPHLPGVTEIQSQAQTEMNKMDADLAQAVKKLDSTAYTADQLLIQVYNAHPSIVDIVTVDTAGYIRSVVPATYQTAVGQFIGDQSHIVAVTKTGKPVMSGMFKTVENFYGCALAYPVFSASGKLTRLVSAVFKPDALLRYIINQYSTGGLTVEALAIQIDGQIIYDRDILQVGKMTFSDPAYRSFPDLLALAARATREASGTGSYTFPARFGGSPIKKEAEWATLSLHGTEWRLIISRAAP